jgi:hypothetical protein
MRGYVYVERSRLRSVMRHGLLSAREQWRVLGRLPVAKYAAQMAAARRAYPELEAILRPMERSGSAEERTLRYLDWRDEETLAGSRAIYFLYAPVPDDPRVREFVRDHRGDFLRGRALLEVDLGGARLRRVGEAVDLRRAAPRPSSLASVHSLASGSAAGAASWET